MSIAHLVDARVEGQVLFDGQVVKQRRVVGHECESRLGGDWVGIDIKAGDRQPPAAGRNDPRHRPHRGRLSRAVGPDDGQQLARLDAKGNASRRRLGRQTPYGNHRLRSRGISSPLELFEVYHKSTPRPLADSGPNAATRTKIGTRTYRKNRLHRLSNLTEPNTEIASQIRCATA